MRGSECLPDKDPEASLGLDFLLSQLKETNLGFLAVLGSPSP